MVIEINNRHDPAIANMVSEHMMREFDKATLLHPTQANMHEGYAVLLEQLDKTWAEVKGNNPTNAIDEMIQVGAMAVRFCHDHVMRTHPGEGG
jgi:hypothetical protein|tara:strand:- start:1939 stop:2217 length:279 start_codon:yes stop_codon:yes gene_type:complete